MTGQTRTCPTCAGIGAIDASLPTSQEHKRSRRTANDTTRAAAALITPQSARAIHIRILQMLASAGDLADWQIAQRIDTNASTLRARRSELMHAGMVIDTGRRRKIPTTGRWSVVWKITDRGRVTLGANR